MPQSFKCLTILSVIHLIYIIRQLHSTESLEWNERRAIIKALLSQPNLTNNREVVLKLGKNESIQKEYRYGTVLQTIPGFIRFICLFTCHDDPESYKHPFKNLPICKGHPDAPLVYGLVMPYVAMGSFRDYSGWVKHPQRFRACFLQLVYSLYEAYMEHGFLHNDIHLNNVAQRSSPKHSSESSFGTDFHTFIQWIQSIVEVHKEAPVQMAMVYSPIIR